MKHRVEAVISNEQFINSNIDYIKRAVFESIYRLIDDMPQQKLYELFDVKIINRFNVVDYIIQNYNLTDSDEINQHPLYQQIIRQEITKIQVSI